VGEIHLDHCRVTYTKDRFDRTDPAWDDMLDVVRGQGPLRPDKAEQAGYGSNESPLFKLFQAFRRSTPKPKVAGCYARLLIVPDNDRAEDMVKKFHDGDASYQSDAKWWDLVQEADNQLLTPSPAPASTTATDGSTGVPATLQGFGVANASSAPSAPPMAVTPASPEMPIASLSGEYRSDSTNQRWDVRALEVLETHPLLCDSKPWTLRAQPNGVHEYLVNIHHPVFASATMTPLDSLLAELAHSAMDFLRGTGTTAATFGIVLAELRSRYAGLHALNPVTLGNEARRIMLEIAATVPRNIDSTDAASLFSDLPTADQEAIIQKMATRAAGTPQTIIANGRFLEYAPPRIICDFFSAHPELFLDGKCWDDGYETIDYGLVLATQEARAQVVRHYESLLADAVWLASQDSPDLSEASRARLLRAQLALELLTPNDGEPAT
jgi:hypothetical protein